MRSNTLMPMLQFVNWWGLDPWYVSGIDKKGTTNQNLTTSGDPSDDCICMVQHSWDSKKHWSRDDLKSMVQDAEDFFIKEARYYPATEYIELERKNNNINSALKVSEVNSKGRHKSFKPKFACELKSFGQYDLILNGVETLVREVLGVLQDEFSVTFTVPLGTLAEDIRVFFTPADGAPADDPKYYEREYEIRPLTITVDGTNATIFGGAYLFKKPALDESLVCVYHETSTYVEEVSIYIVTRDNCSDGNYICNDNNCNTIPCLEETYPICITKRYVGGQYWGVPQIAQCNDELVLTKYCLTCVPNEIEYNYLTGVETDVGGYMNDVHVDVLSKLSIGLLDCKKEWCDCIVCSNKKIKYYRETPHALGQIETSRQEYDLSWDIVLSEFSISRLKGMPPYNGILQALKFIDKNNCTSLEGAMLWS